MTDQQAGGTPHSVPPARVPGGPPARVAGRGRRWGLVALASGVAVLVAAGVLAWRSGPAPSVGADEARRLAASAPPTTGGSAGSGGQPAAGSAGPQAIQVQPGAVPTGATAVGPVRLSVPKIGLTARVLPVGVDPATNDFAVPPSIDVVGWYKYGPGLEAATGSVVVAGHVDSAEQGRGAFFRLGELAPGDRVTLTGPDGGRVVYEVVAREAFRKTSAPLDRFFARDGAARLTLITCGGPFDESTRHYRDNIVVTARRLG